MIIRNATPSDYGFLLQAVDTWWADEDAHDQLDPLFVRQFSDTGFVAEEGGRVIGFLLGCTCYPDNPEGYIHMVASDPCCRQQGVASALYGAFAARVRQKGCSKLVIAINPANHQAICFHLRLGFEHDRRVCDSELDGIPVVSGYAGPGQDRVVMVKQLDPA